jgi:hypothetical protein
MAPGTGNSEERRDVPFSQRRVAVIIAASREMPAMRFAQCRGSGSADMARLRRRRPRVTRIKAATRGAPGKPLSRREIFSASFLRILHRNINKVSGSKKFPLTT